MTQALISVVSAYYYLRVVAPMYMREGEGGKREPASASLALRAGLALAAVVLVLLGLWPTPIVDLARTTVTSLLGG